MITGTYGEKADVTVNPLWHATHFRYNIYLEKKKIGFFFTLTVVTKANFEIGLIALRVIYFGLCRNYI